MRTASLLLVVLTGCGGEDAANVRIAPWEAGESGEAWLLCEALDAPRVLRGERAERIVRCQNPFEREIVGKAVLEGHAAYSLARAELAVPAGSFADVVIDFAPQAVGTHRTTLILRGGPEELARIDLETGAQGEVMEVRVEHVRCPARIAEPEMHDRHIDFGSVPLGASCELQFVFRNHSVEALEIRDFSLDPTSAPEFTMSPVPRELPPFDPASGPSEVRVSVWFTPVEATESVGRVNLVSADPSSPVRYSNFRGLGVLP